MNPYIILLVVAPSVIAVGVVREICKFCKRRQRRAELKRFVDSILQKGGCADAMLKYEECEHIVEHYGIDLEEAGYPGDLETLRMAATSSEGYYVIRMETPLTEPFSPSAL